MHMGMFCTNCNPFDSAPEIDAQPTRSQANAASDIGATAANTDIGVHGRLNRFAIGSASRQREPCDDQQPHTKDFHHTSAFHRLIWART